MIRYVGTKWFLFTRDGKHVLGEHDTFKEAHSQEVAIQLSKARKAGYRIPKKSARKATRSTRRRTRKKRS